MLALAPGVWPSIKLTVYVAEPRCFALFRMVEATGPINRNVAFSTVESCSAFHTATPGNAAKLEQTVEYWAIVSDIVFPLLFGILFHVIRRNLRQKINVFVCVELAHFLFGGRLCSLGNGLSFSSVLDYCKAFRGLYINFHFFVEPVVHD